MRSYFYELELLLILLCLLLLYAAKGAKKNGIYSHNTFNLCTVIFCQRNTILSNHVPKVITNQVSQKYDSNRCL